MEILDQEKADSLILSIYSLAPLVDCETNYFIFHCLCLFLIEIWPCILKKHLKMNTAIISGTNLNRFHSIVVTLAFLTALVLAVKLHYFKVVKNSYYGYPDEWIPSVSAVIGDRFPERNVFQLLMALAGILRMGLLVLSSAQHDIFNARFSRLCFFCGFLRMWLAGAWIYFPSGDWNNFHDVTMILYLICTAMYHRLLISAKTSINKSMRSLTVSKNLLVTLFCEVPVLVLFFLLHKVYKRAGAYSIYALFEWLLILIDVCLDYFAFGDLLQGVSLSFLEIDKYDGNLLK
jgi:hypothetical protein